VWQDLNSLESGLGRAIEAEADAQIAELAAHNPPDDPLGIYSAGAAAFHPTIARSLGNVHGSRNYLENCQRI
jgi:hypothetical protein